MAAIEALCPRSIHLATTVVQDGKTSEVVASYLDPRSTRSRRTRPYLTAIQEGLALESVHIGPSVIRTGDAVDLEFAFQAERSGEIRECGVLIYSIKGFRIAVVDVRECRGLPFQFERGYFAIRARIAAIPVVEGAYTVGLWLVANKFAGNLLELEDFTVVATRSSNDFVPYHAENRGVIVLKAETSVIAERMDVA
jgi:hypothetical protein